MNPEERERMNALCKRIQEEKDPKVFEQLLRELNALLETHETDIHESWKKDPFVTKLSE